MTSMEIGTLILLGSFILFVMMRIPVCYSLIGSSVLTCLYLKLPVMVIWQRLTTGVQSFSLLAVPFFILAGEIMMSGGISNKLMDFADIFVGRFRGGMAYVNILASTFFGAVSGSATADISSIGATMIPLMEKQGYDRDYAINVTVTSATQSMIIPPSHNMIVYAMAAGGVSCGRLFLGGGVVLVDARHLPFQAVRRAAAAVFQVGKEGAKCGVAQQPLHPHHQPAAAVGKVGEYDLVPQLQIPGLPVVQPQLKLL